MKMQTIEPAVLAKLARHWSETAINDLPRIGRRVGVASPANADRLVDQIEAKVDGVHVLRVKHSARKRPA